MICVDVKWKHIPMAKKDSQSTRGGIWKKYQIEKTNGSVFTAYDSNLEVIRRPERRIKNCNRSKKKPQREMER